MKKKIMLPLLILAAILIPTGLFFAGSRDGGDTPGWHGEEGEQAYYVCQDGSRAAGYQIIGGTPYYFDQEGQPAKAGWIREEDETVFYCLGDGHLATGWQYLDGKVWYFHDVGDGAGLPPGRLAGDWESPGGIHIPAEGCIDGDEGLALAYGIDVLNRYGWSLESAYRYSASLRFEEGSDQHYGFRTHLCAIYGFKNGGGNCLAWSGTFCTMARLLGYDCRQVWGSLKWRGTVPHAWTEIWDSGEPRVYDPRKHDGEDMAGFDVEYGEKGSYKYDLDSREYLEW